MGRIALSAVLVLLILFLVPFPVYGALSAAKLVEVPEGAVGPFVAGVFVSKAGTALVFVLIFHLARDVFGRRWLLYGLLWWIFFVFGEVGQAIAPGYTWWEAVGGIIAETVYCPAAALVTARLLRARA